ncbi:hypothetical protein [Stenotrophomonas sp.]|uniref:hypothetical protein n=1 Tax=Stenotrophomonas sp. TaxID=69392 RepID=UPI002D77C542|nr:hypothetical protein [Stenotrophomonas sp.]
MDMHDPYRAPALTPVPPPLLPAAARSFEVSTAAVYYSPSTMKIAALSLATLGLYPLYWFWQNWRAIKRETGGTQWPWARALFSPIWAFFCFSDLRDIAQSRRRQLAFAPGLLGVLFFLLNFAGRLPSGGSLLSLLTFVPLLPVNSLLRRYHMDEKVDMERMDRFGVWHFLVLLAGGSLLLLAIVAFVVGEVD